MMSNCPKLLAAVCVIVASLVLPACSNPGSGKKNAPPDGDTVRLFAGNAYAAIDQSPMDITYFPHDYPQHKIGGGPAALEPPVARVIYSRPHKKGRLIFAIDPKSLCPYGKPWRMGANEATEIDFFKPVIIDGKNVAIGRYVLYCIPYPDKWIVVLNSNLDSWGLQIDPAKDILRVEVPVQVQNPVIEDFTIVFQPATYGMDFLCTWDNVKVTMPINFSK